jgi:hypothetical protein
MEKFVKIMAVVFGIAFGLFLWLKDLAKNIIHIKWKRILNGLIIFSLFGGLVFGIWVVIIEASKEEKPLLNVFQGPVFQNQVADSIPIALSIKNFGKATAKKIDARILSVDDYGSGFILTNNISAKSSDEKEITAEGIYAYYMNFKISKLKVIAVTYVYFRVSYTDQFGVPSRDTIREIYHIPNPISRTALIFDAQKDEFNRVKSFLVDNKLW